MITSDKMISFDIPNNINFNVLARKTSDKEFKFTYYWKMHSFNTNMSYALSNESGFSEYVTTAKRDIDAWNKFNEYCRNMNYDYWNVEYLDVVTVEV